MIPVAEAHRRIVDSLSSLPSEDVAVSEAVGRRLATSLVAKRTQPPANFSAMDGFAVRSDDAKAGEALKIIGTAAAGGAPAPPVGPGQAVRIFTGAALPPGADTVVIQEDCDISADDDRTRLRVDSAKARHVRAKGLDFIAGNSVLEAGENLRPETVALAAAAGYGHVPVFQRARIALLSTGDELVPAGVNPQGHQIVDAVQPSLVALLSQAGAQVTALGIAGDQIDLLRERLAQAKDVGLIVTVGGASVGERDLIKSLLGPDELNLDFWKIRMRPGKPLIFGRYGNVPMLGLPGNPVSALVCARLFLLPAIDRLHGGQGNFPRIQSARSAINLPPGGTRDDYQRAHVQYGDDALPEIRPFDVQDSSMLSLLAQSQGLLVRPAGSDPAPAGTLVPYLPLYTTE